MIKIGEHLLKELLLNAASIEFFPDGTVKRIEFRQVSPTPRPRRVSVQVTTQRIHRQVRMV